MSAPVSTPTSRSAVHRPWPVALSCLLLVLDGLLGLVSLGVLVVVVNSLGSIGSKGPGLDKGLLYSERDAAYAGALFGLLAVVAAVVLCRKLLRPRRAVRVWVFAGAVVLAFGQVPTLAAAPDVSGALLEPGWVPSLEAFLASTGIVLPVAVVVLVLLRSTGRYLEAARPVPAVTGPVWDFSRSGR